MIYVLFADRLGISGYGHTYEVVEAKDAKTARRIATREHNGWLRPKHWKIVAKTKKPLK